MRKFLIFPIFLALSSPATFMIFLVLYNYFGFPSQFLLSIVSTAIFLVSMLLFSIKKFKKNSKTALRSLFILAVFSPIFITIYLYLPGILLFFDTGPAEHWPAIFIAQRLNLSGYKIHYDGGERLLKTESDLIRVEWDFKKPEGFSRMLSIKFTEKPVWIASFYYSDTKKAQIAFNKYREQLESEYEITQLNTSLKKTYMELNLYDHFTVKAENRMVHCELLVRERSDNAAILVVIAGSDEIDFLRKLLE